MAELAARVYPHGVPTPSDNRGLYVGHATDAIIDAVTRLLDLMAGAEDADLLAPLVVDEILIRLLRTPIRTRVAGMGEPRSGVRRYPESGALDTRFSRDPSPSGRSPPSGQHRWRRHSIALQGG